MKYLLLLGFLAVCKSPFAQDDFLILKKKNGKVLERYFPGKTIRFSASDYTRQEGYITRIKHDTLFLNYYVIQLMPTKTGGMWPDTAQTYHLAYDYHDIVSIDDSRNSLRSSSMGTFLQTGGIAFAAIGMINGLSRQEKGKKFFSGSYVIAAPVLYLSGWLIKHSSSKKKIIGKKYSLQYVKLSAKQPSTNE